MTVFPVICPTQVYIKFPMKFEVDVLHEFVHDGRNQFRFQSRDVHNPPLHGRRRKHFVNGGVGARKEK